MPSPDISAPFRLSRRGSTRATAYGFANKSVRVGDTTHAVWLDGVSSVMAASFDHRAGAWSSPVYVDDGRDNHTCPTLTAAPDGRLRLAYGPRSCPDPFSNEPMNAWAMGKFRMLQSAAPGDSSKWGRLSHVGYAATYGCLVTDHLGRDHIVYNGGNAPPSVRYERRRPDDAWDRDVRLSYDDVGHNYTHTGAHLAARRDGVMACAFHYFSSPRDSSLGVCALKSEDGGETWTAMDGSPVRLPLEFTPACAVPSAGACPYLGTLATDARGRFLAVTHDMGDPYGGCLFSVYERGGWRTTRLDPFLPAGMRVQSASATADTAGRVLVIVECADAKLRSVAERWCHPANRVWLLVSSDEGRTFSNAVRVSEGDPGVADWLPTISHTGPNHDLRSPLVMWTRGVSGTGRNCIDPERTEVWAAWV
ncbi:MAG: BNR repeat-containing protein [Planctomycetes bacterium]|nr:BNR repeat-containing protein [Planctomycetota bacterium]